MSDQIKLDGQTFYNKLAKIQKTWNEAPMAQDALLVVMGKVSDDPLRKETSDFFLWLLNYEFSDTILLLTRDKVIFAVSPKKSKLLEQIDVPEALKTMQLVIVRRDPKVDPIKDTIAKVMDHLPHNSTKVAVFQKDKEDGDLTKSTLEAIDAKKLHQVDMKDLIDRMNRVKIASEIANQRTSAQFADWTFKKLVQEVEDIIDSDKPAKHSHIQKKIEACLDSDKEMNQFLQKRPKVNPSFLDYQLPVLIQSGHKFTVNKFGLESTDELLNPNCIYLNVCSKFCDMNCMVSRTLLVNPKEVQQRAYNIGLAALDICIKNLKAGSQICDAYQAAKNYVQSQDSELASRLHSNFGFGIGTKYREDLLQISESNQTVVEENMVFHVRITLQGVHSDVTRSVIAIGDTIAVRQGGNEVFTSLVQRSYQDISYSLDDEEDEAEVPAKQEPKKKTKQQASSSEESKSYSEEEDGDEDLVDNAKKQGTTVFTSSRLRSKGLKAQEKQNEYFERRGHQKELILAKVKELQGRFDRGEIKFSTKKEKVKKMNTICAYKSIDDFPKDLKAGQLYVDTKENSILVPVDGDTFVPFHVSTIKNASETTQGQWTYLRVNFHLPGGNMMQFPAMESAQALYIKELTFKTSQGGSNNRLKLSFQKIRECIKNVKTKEAEDQVKHDQVDHQVEELQTIKGRKDILENVVVRPNLSGKKTIGSLEIHQNGVRFSSTKGERVDVTFSNVKHCFYQPCGSDELIVIIHFTLRSPISVGNKKVTDVQFFKESGVAAEDINFKRGRSKLTEMDELEQEERERMQRRRLNAKFLAFATQIESQAAKCKIDGFEVDIPVDELFFYGCAMKSVVKIRPTKNCLIAISEFPFFVIDVNDIEVVHFERVSYGIKNYDLTIIFKDFMTYKRISAIPIEFLEDQRSFFDEIGIIYSEGLQPLNWTTVLAEIREKFNEWLEEGAWQFLQEDDENEENGEDEMSDEEDPGAVYDSEDDEEESESDFSEASDEESSGSASESLSEAGLSWDELDKQAEEEDRRAASRRTVRPQPPTHKKGGRR